MDVANLLSSTSVSSNTSTTSYPLTELQESMLDFLQRSFLSSYHHNLAIIQIESERFLLGIQLAKLLRRETSNLYRSLKRARIPLVRASSDQVRWINSLNLCFVQKTHSITFIPLRETIDYLTEEFRRRKSSKPETPYTPNCSKILETPKRQLPRHGGLALAKMQHSFSAVETPAKSQHKARPIDFRACSWGMLEAANYLNTKSAPILSGGQSPSVSFPPLEYHLSNTPSFSAQPSERLSAFSPVVRSHKRHPSQNSNTPIPGISSYGLSFPGQTPSFHGISETDTFLPRIVLPSPTA